MKEIVKIMKKTISKLKMKIKSKIINLKKYK